MIKKIKNIKLKNKEKMLMAITFSVVGITAIALIIWKATSGKVQNEANNTLRIKDTTGISNKEESEASKIVTDKSKLAKQTSIDTYGDLIRETIELDYDGKTNYTFQIGSGNVINGFVNLNAELKKQDGKEYAINDIDNLGDLHIDNTKNVAFAKAKKISIDTYGDLINEENKSDYDGTNYTFQISGNTIINGFDDLNAELKKQDGKEHNINSLNLKQYGIENIGADLNNENNDDNFQNETDDYEEVEYQEKKIIFTKSPKLLSIESYGNLFAFDASIKVDYNGTKYTFQIGENTEIIGIDSLNTELNIQKSSDNVNEFNFIDIDQIIEEKASFNFHNLKTLENAKAKKDSIQTYGDFKNNLIDVDYNGKNYTFQIDGKDQIIGLSKLNTELDKQGDIQVTPYTIQDLSAVDFYIYFFDTLYKAFAKPKAKKYSINSYGNLFAENALIKVDYNGKNYTFQIGENTKIIGIDHLNTELDKQDDIQVTPYTIQDLIADVNLLHFDTRGKTLVKAKVKEDSIETYGDLKNDLIDVDYNGKNYTFQIGENTKIIGIDHLNTELDKQGDIQVTPYTIQDLIADADLLHFDTRGKTFAKAKAKETSIETYGDFKNDLMGVNWNETKYTFQIDGKDQIIGLSKLNTELDNQGDTVLAPYTIENLIADVNLLHFDTQGKTLTKAKAKKIKYDSIETYGDFKNDLMGVNWNGTKYTFQIDGKDQIIGLSKLNTELDNQGDTVLAPYTIQYLILYGGIVNFDTPGKTLVKAKVKEDSIETYGDLKNDLIAIDCNNSNNDSNWTFQVSEKKKIENKNAFLKQLILQRVNKINQIKTVLIPDSSRLIFGNLFASDASIKVDYNGTNYTFQIGEKFKIVGLKIFNKQLSIQTTVVEATHTIQDLIDGDSGLHFDAQKSPQKAKAKKASIGTYGDLFADSASIKVDYNGTKYTFQIDNKEKIIGLIHLNNELDYQGDQILRNYTIDDLNWYETLWLDIEKAKAKKNSIEAYGNLKTENISMDYNGTIYTFQIENKEKIENINAFAKQLKMQAITEIEQIQITTTSNASFEIYGDLKATNASIKVDYNGTNYTFQIDEKDQIIGLSKLNTELDKQGDIEVAPYTIEDLITDSGLLHFDTQGKTLAKAKAKKEADEENSSESNEITESIMYGGNYQTDSNALYPSFFAGIILFGIFSWVIIKKFFTKKRK